MKVSLLKVRNLSKKFFFTIINSWKQSLLFSKSSLNFLGFIVHPSFTLWKTGKSDFITTTKTQLIQFLSVVICFYYFEVSLFPQNRLWQFDCTRVDNKFSKIQTAFLKPKMVVSPNLVFDEFLTFRGHTFKRA